MRGTGVHGYHHVQLSRNAFYQGQNTIQLLRDTDRFSARPGRLAANIQYGRTSSDHVPGARQGELRIQALATKQGATIRE